MFTYTKEEVKAFLGSKANDNSALIRSLTRKGFVAKTNGKRGSNLLFILDQELIREQTIVDIVGFEPRRPSYTEALLKALVSLNYSTNKTWAEMSEYIKETQGIEIAPTNLSTAYRELEENNYVYSTTEYFNKETGAVASDKEKDSYRNAMNFFLSNDYSYGVSYQLALNSNNLEKRIVKEINAFYLTLLLG